MINFNTQSRIAMQRPKQMPGLKFAGTMVNPGKIIVEVDGDLKTDLRGPKKHLADTVSHYILPLIKRIEPQLAELAQQLPDDAVMKPFTNIKFPALGGAVYGMALKLQKPGMEDQYVYSFNEVEADEAEDAKAEDLVGDFKKLVTRAKHVLAGGSDPMHPSRMGDI